MMIMKNKIKTEIKFWLNIISPPDNYEEFIDKLSNALISKLSYI